MLKNDRPSGVRHPSATAYILLHFVWPLLMLYAIESAHAQTPPITPSGLNTQIQLSAPLPAGHVQYDITGGIRPGGGVNLFHSLGDFNVPTNNVANFLNAGSVDLAGSLLPAGLPTSNILARVTDGNISNIFGTIQTTDFGNANLFLMNPAGFLFGPNATINVGGMVAFTTADYLRLAGDVQFNAVPDIAVDALLTASPVAAFGFLGPNAASIAIQGGNLEVPDGKTLSFIGGPGVFTTDTGVTVPSGVSMSGGSLSAPNGSIYMTTVTSPSEVPIPILSGAQIVNLALPSVGDAVIRIRSGEFIIDNALLTVPNTGDVAHAPIDINVQGTMTVRNASSISTDTSGLGRGSDVHIAAQSLQLDGSFITTMTTGSGRGGEIAIGGHTQTVNLANGSQIMSSTVGDGDGGAIDLTATDTITFGGFDVNGNPSGTLTSASAGGKGGNVTVSTPDLTLETAFLATTTTGTGAGGTLSIKGPASGTGTLNLNGGSAVFSSAESSGASGSMVLDLAEATLRDGSLVSSQNQGSAEAGAIQITASRALTITGKDAFDHPSTILSDAGFNFTSNQPVSGKGATIDIQAASVTLEILGTIKTNTEGPAQAGDIHIHDTQSLTLSSGASIESSTHSTGSSGLISLDATAISITGKFDNSNLTRLTNRSPGQTDGSNGGINIHAGTFELKDEARIISETSNNAGSGNVTVNADQSASIKSGSLISIGADLQDVASLQITAPIIAIEGHGTALLTRSIGPGKAGDISLTTTEGNLILSGGSTVVSSTEQGSGPGGAIIAHAANSIELSGGAHFTTSSFSTGPAGSITATAGNVVSLSDAGTGFFSEAFRVAPGGNIVVTGSQVHLLNGAIISAKSEPLQGTVSPGDAGNILIDAGNQFAMTNSTVTTEANQASGGIIKITTDPSGTVQLTNSTISASVLDGTGGGGSVDIDPQFVILLNSQILAQAVQGPGGNISITTNLLLPDANSTISASSQFGVNGTVTIQSPNAPISGQIQPLGNTPLIATSLLNQQCASVAGGQFSSFTVAARDRLPTEPGSWLASPLAMLSTGTGEGLSGLSGLSRLSGVSDVARSGLAAHQIDQTDQIDKTDQSPLSLRQIAPAGFLTQAFAVDRSAGCQS